MATTTSVGNGRDRARVRRLLRSREDKRGLLIAFEGPDGSGKTTQRKLFTRWLESQGRPVVTTKWGSSPLVKPLLKARRKVRALSPEELTLLQAADFRHRLEQQILPALWSGCTVVADRYLFTGVASAAVRGVELDWALQAYAPLFWPDIVFNFTVSIDTSTSRIASTRTPKFYDAGQDITDVADAIGSYRVFAPRVMREFENLSVIFRFVDVDGEQAVYQQHMRLRRLFEQSRRTAWGEWNIDALTEWLAQGHQPLASGTMSRKKDEARGDRPQGVLIAVDGMAGADIRKHANGLVRRLRSRKAGVGVSWWDASGLFFEMGLGKRKHRVASPRTLMLLYASDLLFRLRWEIRPALAAGQKVIAAPYLATAFAFGRANGLPAEWLTALFRFAPPPVASYLAQERKKSGRKRGQQAGFAEFSSEVLAAAVPSFDAVAMRQKMIGLLDRGERAAGKGRAARPGRGSRN